MTSGWLVNSNINNHQITEELFNKLLTLLKVWSVQKINTSDKIDQVWKLGKSRACIDGKKILEECKITESQL